MKLSAVVLAKNEQQQLADCLASLQMCDEIIVVDDHSTDRTREIALKHGATVIVYQGPDDFAKKRTFGETHAEHEWVLFVDADERVSDALAQEIRNALHKDSDCNGYYLLRSDNVFGKVQRFGESAQYPLLRLGRRNSGKWIGRVHESWKISGKTAYLRAPLLHYPHQTVAEFLSEINHYSTLRAEELFNQKSTVSAVHIMVFTTGKFLQNYILKLGVLDGIGGLVSALMMSYYSFLVRAKLWQLYQRNEG
jgi:glycosyltransferase involved in cell wall biosynthesis